MGVAVGFADRVIVLRFKSQTGFADHLVVLLYKPMGLPVAAFLGMLPSLTASTNICKRELVLGIGIEGR